MRVGIYTPYLNSFGGGERYVLTVAELLSQDHTVDLLLDKHQASLDIKNIKIYLAKHFDLNLSAVRLVKAPLGPDSSFFKRLFFLKGYDLFFYLTDGSVFYSTAEHNLIHFQVPFPRKSKGFWSDIKLSSWNLAICNSRFTQSYIEKDWPIKTKVIYPPVEVEKIKPLQKKKYILSVGRFNSFLRSKKHEEMIKTFHRLYLTGQIKDWSLHLVGSVEGDESYIDELRAMAKDVPIFFYPNLSFPKLVRLYGESSIYWHAAGFGETDPTKMEHFGITTVEAMAGGCVPVVIDKGGQPEIIEDGHSGFLWDNPDQLKTLTLKLISQPDLMGTLAKTAVIKSQRFSKKRFKEEIKEIIINKE